MRRKGLNTGHMDRRRVLLAGALLVGSQSPVSDATAGAPAEEAGRELDVVSASQLALRPPMGWNSWNSFATTISEERTLELAQIMAAKLLPFGDDIFTIDIQWYEPNASSCDYSTTPHPTLVEHGRLLPVAAASPHWRRRSTGWA